MADEDVGGRAAVRRAPFSDNPELGARGQRTRQSILDAAIAVFGEQGYHQCSIDSITRHAGCSRVSFYQYFSGKEDIFHQLSGQVARLLGASAEALGPITADADGWDSLRAWIARDTEIHRRYQPVYHAFPAASATDPAVATGSAQWQGRTVVRVRSKVVGSNLRPRQLDAVIGLLLSAFTSTQDMAGILRSEVPSRYGDAEVGDAFTDLFHRSLFGRIDGVNVHGRPSAPLPRLRLEPAALEVFVGADDGADLSPAGTETFERLLEAGREVFVERGFHRTRIDDIAEAAGRSHGAFYRYFDDKSHLARVLTTRALTSVREVLVDIPPLAPAGPRLRRWLRRYHALQIEESAMLRVWMDAAVQEAAMRPNSAPALDWARGNMAERLEPRGFGDPQLDGLLVVAVLSAFGRRHWPAGVDGAYRVIARGFLGDPDG